VNKYKTEGDERTRINPDRNVTRLSRLHSATRTTVKFIPRLISLDADVKFFYFFSRPGSFAQEREARLDARIKIETPDVDDASQILPSKMLNKFSHDHFQCFPVKGIFCHSDKSKNKHSNDS
jgi:hypothetical protein